MRSQRRWNQRVRRRKQKEVKKTKKKMREGRTKGKINKALFIVAIYKMFWSLYTSIMVCL